MIQLPQLTVIVGLVAALSGLAGGWAARAVVADRDMAEVKALHAQERQRQAEKAQAAAEEYRQRELIDRERVADAQREREKERQARIAAERRAAAGTERVLDAAGAWSCSPASRDPIAASGDDATSLRELLEPLLQGYRDAVDAAEEHASDVRTLLRAWPVRAAESLPKR